MTWWFWKYAEQLKKNTMAGAIYIDITTGKQQLFKILTLVVKAVSGDNSGGISVTDVFLELASTGTNKNFINPTTAGTVILPDIDDYLESFQTLGIRGFVLGDGDKIILRRNYIAVDGQIIVEVRGLLSTNAKPNIKLTAFTESSNLYHNEIVGVIEE
nr:MAG: hypothetical protein [uncultured archaeon]